MSTISFGGLASGLDTDAIVEALMEVESQPLKRLESDQSYYQSRLSAFSDFESKLNGLKSAFEALDTADEFRSYTATAGSDEFFSFTASSSASAGSYEVEVVNLARVQKDVANGFASVSESTFSAGTIDINGTSITVEDGDSLGDIVDKINLANIGDSATGVTASIIDDGTENGFRIVLTGENASTSFTATASGVSSGGTELSFTNTQAAQQATAIIDGITVVSDNNTLKDAIPGVNLDLLKQNEAGTKTLIEVSQDDEAIKAKLDEFVSAYNGIVNFIAEQQDSSWANDSGMLAAKRRLQSMLVERVGGSTGNFNYLVDIGIKTNKEDGTISFDSTKLSDAIKNDFESLEKLIVGEDGAEGIAEKFTSYIDDITDSIDGLYASRKKSTDSILKRIDSQIQSMNMRLEKREENLRAEFAALETLMSSMNSTSTYLAQQLSHNG